MMKVVHIFVGLSDKFGQKRRIGVVVSEVVSLPEEGKITSIKISSDTYANE